MHGCTHGEDNIADLTGDAGILGNFHVGRNGSYGGASAEGNCGRLEQVREHDLNSTLAAAEPCVNGEEDEHISKAYYIIDD